MNSKEVNLRSIVFLVVGILLLLSLVICIYIVRRDNDLVKIKADVIDVKKDSDGTGKNDVTVIYEVGNTSYKYNFYYKDEVNNGDQIDIYYHEKNVTSVQTFKTGKYIFICPIIGLVLCVVGLYELFKKNPEDDDADEFKTQVIDIVGDTQKLEIIPDEPVEEPKKEEPVVEEVKEEVKEEIPVIEEPVEKAKKIIPSNYYLSGKTLVYEEAGKETHEINLIQVRNIIKTINKAGKVVKLIVVTDDLQCILISMKDINLEEVANLLHNRMLSIDEKFNEEIEYKEY